MREKESMRWVPGMWQGEESIPEMRGGGSENGGAAVLICTFPTKY